MRWSWLILLVLVLDQASKYWAEHILQHNTVVIFESWFDLSLAHNTGAAFSFLANAGGWQQVFFFLLAVIVSVVLLVMMSKLQRHERHLAICYALIIGGAIGNAIDRAIYQYVIDFIHWYYKDWHWPYFNIADSAIFLGAVLMLTEAAGKPFLNIKTDEDSIS